MRGNVLAVYAELVGAGNCLPRASEHILLFELRHTKIRVPGRRDRVRLGERSRVVVAREDVLQCLFHRQSFSMIPKRGPVPHRSRTKRYLLFAPSASVVWARGATTPR